jgi:hypothetical protein
MTSFNKYRAFFFTKEVSNKGFDEAKENTPLKEARIRETFRSSIVDKADNYVLAVERFEIGLNGIQFYEAGRVLTQDGFTAPERIEITDLATPPVILETNNITFGTYSLPETIIELNKLMQLGGVGSMGLAWSVDSEGFVRAKFNAVWLNTYRLSLTNCPLMNQILGVETTGQTALQGAGATEIKSLTPRWDMGDNLGHLRLTSNLPVVSDSVGQSKSNILTDLSFLNNIGASYGYTGAAPEFVDPSVSYSQRQKVVYNPAERRYLNLRSSAPIDDIDITCEYVRPDGTSAVVELPKGASFSVKLGFFSRA